MAQDQPVRFIVFSTQRTGSTWLVDLLHHSGLGIRAYGEAFLNRPVVDLSKIKWGYIAPPIRYYEWNEREKRRRPFGTLAYLRHLENVSQGYEAVGFKLMYNQLHSRPELICPLVWRRYRIVHLVRENILDIAISQAIMQQKRRVHTTEAAAETVQVSVDPTELLTHLGWIEARIRRARMLARWLPVPAMEITYEQLHDQLVPTMRGVVEFLGRSGEQLVVDSNLVRANPGRQSDKVANFDQVAAALKGTRFEPFLDTR